MERQKIVIEPPLVIGNFTIIAVALLEIGGAKGSLGIYFSGFKKPIAVVISTPDEVKAFTASGSYMPLDKLVGYVPELASLLKLPGSDTVV